MEKITLNLVERFRMHLKNEEKASATVEKYISDVLAFKKWSNGTKVSKQLLLEYKAFLKNSFAPASVNSILSSLNSFFAFLGEFDLRIKLLKIQKHIFSGKELTKPEYERLLCAAKKRENSRLYYLMQTICSTGIRVSELRYITVEALKERQATISCKGKLRVVILPDALCKMLNKYIKERKIKSGAIFVTKNGRPLDRSNICHDMKKLCESAHVPREKVFPHNLRHLFARTYYSIQKDIVRLADILGHSSINTTRIYTVESGDVHRKQIQRLGLLIC